MNGIYQEYAVRFFFFRGHILVDCLYEDNLLHGEYKEWDANRKLTIHCLYIKGEKHTESITNLSPEEKLLLSIKYNVKWLK